MRTGGTNGLWSLDRSRQCHPPSCRCQSRPAVPPAHSSRSMARGLGRGQGGAWHPRAMVRLQGTCCGAEVTGATSHPRALWPQTPRPATGVSGTPARRPPCGMLERANGHQPARACGGGTRSHSAKQWTRVGAAGTAACGAATTPHGSFRTLPISRGPEACRAKGALLDRDVAVRRFNRMASPYLHGSWLVLPIPSRYRAGFPSDVEPANGDPP